jgi:hypothetical protein
MSQLTSKFDLISEESFASPMAMAITLAVSPTFGATYSSTPAVNTSFPAGTIVELDSTGKAAVATGRALFGDVSGVVIIDRPKLFAVVIDGSDTFTGSFTNKLTCLIGGFQMITEEFTGNTFAPGDALAVGAGTWMASGSGSATGVRAALTYSGAMEGTAGKLRKATAFDQVFGYVGPKGYNAADETLHVIVPHK